MRTKSRQADRWITRRLYCRPNTRRYAFISVLLCLSSLAAVQYLTSPNAGLVPAADAAFFVVLAVTAVTLLLTLWSVLTEKPRPVRQRFRDPNYKLSEL